MKNIYLFIVLLILIGCKFNPLSQVSSVPTVCPSVLFATEHKTYIGSLSKAITLENIAYQAKINNATFVKGCEIKNNSFSSYLSLLFIVSPFEKIEDTAINLPFYVAVVNANKDIIDIQYYMINSILQNNLKKKEVIETEIIKDVLVRLPYLDESLSVIIGFMLDKRRLEILN